MMETSSDMIPASSDAGTVQFLTLISNSLPMRSPICSALAAL